MSSAKPQSRGHSMVEAYVVPGRVVLSALTPLDQHAAWTATDALVVVNEAVADEELGTALTDMLEQSLTAPEAVGDASEKDLLKAAQVRSYTALVRTARYVSISRDGTGRVLLLPSAPGRDGGGWITVGPEEGIAVDEPSPNALGGALRRAIEKSTSAPVDD